MSILVITTGGTIGAMPYDDIRRQPIYKTMPADGTDIVRTILEKDFGRYKLRFVTFEHRDSNFIDGDYRKRLLDIIRQAPEKNILVTHGTDTILVTAEFFYRRQKDDAMLRDKVIVLVGATVALSCGAESDGFHNMSLALNQLSQPLTNGVYIVLSDFEDAKTQMGWGPHLYSFEPNKYGKTKDLDNMHRSRLYLLADQENNAAH